jgi:hypothetical protein
LAALVAANHCLAGSDAGGVAATIRVWTKEPADDGTKPAATELEQLS